MSLNPIMLLSQITLIQDYPELSKFKDALRQAAETITTVKTVFSDASANSGEQ